MDQRVVVGVGNIYAAEALFAAGVSPLRAAGKVSRERYRLLADAVRRILENAITRGGTTLRDFLAPDGAPGYFVQELSAYGRGGAPCPNCGRPLKQAQIGQRRRCGAGIANARRSCKSPHPPVPGATSLRPVSRAMIVASKGSPWPTPLTSPPCSMPHAMAIAGRSIACSPRSTRSCKIGRASCRERVCQYV